MRFIEAAPPLLVGILFTVFACLKFYGLARGIEGGAQKPLRVRLCGT
jgi:hypothetical protein